MAIAKTKGISRLVFYPLALVGTGFTLKLFFDFGSNIFSGIAWAIVGAGMESLKIIFLIRWQNSVFLKRKIKPINFYGYLAMALLCAFASLVFGISTIEKKAIKDMGKTVRSDELRMKIEDAERSLSSMKTSDNTEADRANIQKQIDALTRQIDNVTVGVAERSINLTGEIERLQNKKRMIGREGVNVPKDEAIKKLTELRKEYSEVVMSESDTKGSFEIVAKVLHVPVNVVMVTFLFLVTIAMEVGIAVTSQSAISEAVAIRRKEKKEKDPDQMKFEDVE